MIDTKSFVDYLYSKLPAVYREEDLKVNKALYRYLQVLCLGGFNKSLEDSNNFLTLVDPEKCPESFFRYFYNSFGLEYFEDIELPYHRKFLSNIGALMKRRGTKSAIHYLVTTLTGYEANLDYERIYNEQGVSIERRLTVTLLIHDISEAEKIVPSVKVLESFIHSQLPFYLHPIVQAATVDDMYGNLYSGGLITQRYGDCIYPFGGTTHSDVNGADYIGCAVSCSPTYTLTPQLGVFQIANRLYVYSDVTVNQVDDSLLIGE